MHAAVDGYVAVLAREAVMAVNQFAVAHDARAQTRAEGDYDEVFHAFGVAEDHLADGRGIGVVGDGHVHARERRLDVVHEVEHAARLVGILLVVAEFPQVGGGLDHARMEVGVRRADTYSYEFEIERHAADQGVHGLAQSLHIGVVVVEFLVSFGRDGRFAEYRTLFIDESECRVGTADVDTHCQFFHSVS